MVEGRGIGKIREVRGGDGRDRISGREKIEGGGGVEEGGLMG